MKAMLKLFLFLAALVVLGSCDFFSVKKDTVSADPQNSVVVTSVSPTGLSSGAAKTLASPNIEYRYSDSCPPDYLTVTLTGISVIQGASNPVVLWSGTKELLLSGDGLADVGAGLTLSPLPEGKIDTIRLEFSCAAKIKGTLVGDFEDPQNSQLSVSKTYYTKAAYVFDPLLRRNIGAIDPTPATVFETGPAEASTVYLAGGPGDPPSFFLDTASTFIADPAKSSTLTILVDLSRMLRFDDGRQTAGDAHFFSNSVFSSSVAAFFGEVGSIQGYSTLYSTLDYYDRVGDTHNTTNVKEVPGWMTLAFDSQGTFLSGMTIGDDDNALTISKGLISNWRAGTAGTFDFSLGISLTEVSGFSPVASHSLGSSSPDVQFTSQHGPNEEISGEARFTLVFETP